MKTYVFAIYLGIEQDESILTAIGSPGSAPLKSTILAPN